MASHFTQIRLRRPTTGALTNAEEAELLRDLGEQARGKRLFGFEVSFYGAPVQIIDPTAPSEALRFLGTQLRYYAVIAQGREVAEKIVHRYWRSAWPEANATIRSISPEAAFALSALVLLERPEGWQDDGTSADTEHRFSHVEDRCLLAALLATMAREGDVP